MYEVSRLTTIAQNAEIAQDDDNASCCRTIATETARLYELVHGLVDTSARATIRSAEHTSAGRREGYQKNTNAPSGPVSPVDEPAMTRVGLTFPSAVIGNTRMPRVEPLASAT